MRSVMEIVKDMTTARQSKDQETLNALAIELTELLWKPDIGMSFQELSEGFGYVDTKSNNLVKRRKP
jgi:hypothetical protein